MTHTKVYFTFCLNKELCDQRERIISKLQTYFQLKLRIKKKIYKQFTTLGLRQHIKITLYLNVEHLTH